MSEFTATIRAVLDDSKIPAQLASIDKKHPYNISNVVVDGKQIVSQIQSILNNGAFTVNIGKVNFDDVTRAAKGAGVDMGRSIADSIRSQISSSLSPLNIRNSTGAISNMERALRSMNFDTSSIQKVTKNINEMQLAITSIRTTMAGDNIRLTVNGIDQANRAVQIIQQLNEETNNFETISKTFNHSFVSKDAGRESVEVFRELQDVLKNIGAVEQRIKGLNAFDNSKQVLELVRQLDELQNKYKTLRESANLSDIQSQRLSGMEEVNRNKIAELNAMLEDLAKKSADSEIIQQSISAYKELQSILTEIGSLKTKIAGLDSSSSGNQIDVLTSRLNELNTKYNDLMSGAKSNLTLEQLEGLDQTSQKTKEKIDELAAKLADVSAAKESESAYKELKSVLDEINSTQLKIKGLNPVSNASQIEELNSQLETLRDKFNSIWDTKSSSLSEKQLEGLISVSDKADKKLAELYARIADQRSIKDTTQAYSELQSILNEINSIELKIKGLDSRENANQIAALTKQLDELKSRYDALGLANSDKFSAQQFAGLFQSAEKAGNKISELDAKILDLQSKAAQQIQLKINTGNIDSSIASVVSQYEKLSATGHAGLASISNDINELRRLQTELANSSSPDHLISTYKQFQEVLSRTKSHLSVVTSETRNLASTISNQALTAKMQQWLANNSKAAKDYGYAINQLIAKNQQMGASGTQTINDLRAIDAEFRQITIDAHNAGVTGSAFGSALARSLKSIIGIVDLTSLIRTSIRYTKQLATEVINVDTSMTGLRRVTELTSDQYKKMYSEMVVSAKQYGATLTDIIDGTTNWVKLGFAPEVSQQLANITATYQHVTDLDTNTATKNLITAYKGFEKTLLKNNNNDIAKAVSQITDIYDKLGNEFAESAADVGDGLSKSAAVLQEGGASIQEAAGMFTGIQEVLQNSSVAGNTLKILTLRIRGMKGELEELGEEVDDKIESVSKIQTQILNLTHGKVNIFEDNGNFKNIYTIMNEISKAQKEMSDTESAALLELVAGKSRSVGVQALLDNWEQVEKATKAAYEAEGTAAKEQEKYIASLQGKINSFKASLSALANSILDSNFFKFVVDSGTSIITVLDNIINKLGSIPTLIGAITAVRSFQGKGELIIQFLS